MLIKTANVATGNAGRYIPRLCRHFNHKVPAEWSDHAGSVEFPVGICRLEAREEALMIRCESANGEDLSRLCEIVASHLVRFAAGARESEELEVVWKE